MIHLLGQLENRAVLDTMAKEVIGINAPKIALTRTKDERIDAAVSEIGNTAAFVGAGGAGEVSLRKLFASAQREGAPALSKNWAVLGRSGAIFSIIFSLMWAMPFVRNYITARRTGAVKFTEVIGAGGRADAGKSDLRKALAEYKKKAVTIAGLGLAGALLSAGGARLAISRNWGLGPLKHLFSQINVKGKSVDLSKALLLDKGSFSDFSGLKALLFWGVPAYGGWIHASRDPYEKKEQLLKFVNFVACFFGPQLLMKRFFNRKLAALGLETFKQGGQEKAVALSYKSIQAAKAHFKGLGRADQLQKLEQAESLWKKNTLGGLLSSIALLGTMPQLLNIYLTNRRVARDSARHQNSPVPAPPRNQPVSGLAYKKDFSQWGVRPAQPPGFASVNARRR